MIGLQTCLYPASTRVLLALLVLGLTACASPPRGADSSGGTESDSTPRTSSEDQKAEQPSGAYDFEAEGAFPEERTDVEFEEDRLPPPETVEGEAVDRGGIESEELDAPEAPFEEPAEARPVQPRTEAPVEPRREIPLKGSDPGVGQRGFRVQLAATGERTDADRVAREARNRLRVETYVVFEGSLYKVRAGDYVDRGEALRLRDRARTNGYDGAWVVPTEIEG